MEQIKALSDQLDAMMLLMVVHVKQLHVSWMRMMWLTLVRPDLNGRR
jgi:hypothetical protein